MRLVLLICAVLMAPAAFAQKTDVNGATPSGRSVVEREGEPGIINFDDDDGAMNAAIAEARGRLPYFFDQMSTPEQGVRGFTLKVGFPVASDDGTQREHIWVEDVERRGAGFVGNLANEPNWMEGKSQGDAVTFTEDMISDWGFERRRKLIGFYTLRVMLPDMPPEEAAPLRAMLGDNPQ